MLKWIDSISESISKFIVSRNGYKMEQEIRDWKEIKRDLRTVKDEVRETVPKIEEEEKRKETNKDRGSIL